MKKLQPGRHRTDHGRRLARESKGLGGTDETADGDDQKEGGSDLGHDQSERDREPIERNIWLKDARDVVDPRLAEVVRK